MGKTTLPLYLFATVILCSLFVQSCGEAFDPPGAVGEESITISGKVLNKSNSQPVEGAFVEITDPPEYQRKALTDPTGRYSFAIQTESAVNLTIQATKQKYEITTKKIAVAPGSDYKEVNLLLTSVNDGGNGDDDDGGVEGEPQGAAAIVLTSVPLQAINIAETGDVVSAPFTFVVQDSAGRALNAKNPVKVHFKLITSPGGGESLVPTSAMTNAQGKVTTTLFSGNKAGPVKVQAIVKRPEVGLVIKSSPVLIAIHGGFPDAEHFSIAAEKLNFEGWSRNNRRNTITVILGDKFSNPVKPGTVVYFETTGGIINGSATTDQDGVATVDLISGDPRPTGGLATVTATTINAAGNRISKQIDIIFSTTRANISASPTTFNIPPNGGTSFTYTVTDLNGNPMAAGTKIKVEAGKGIEVTGDADFTLGNFINPGPGSTEFNFSIRDTDEKSNGEAGLTIKISVTTPSGNTTTYSGISGTRH